MVRNLLAALAVVCCTGASAADAPALLSPDVAIGGRSQQDWSRHWWEWAASFDDDVSPVADRTGALPSMLQAVTYTLIVE